MALLRPSKHVAFIRAAANRDDAGNLSRMFPTARIVRLERPSYAPPLRAADTSSKVAVVWRKEPENSLPKGAEPEFTQIAGDVAVTPERVSVRWQPYPPTSAERVFVWMIAVADPRARE